MWEPRPLATLGVSTACNRDIFIFLPFTMLTDGELACVEYTKLLSVDKLWTLRLCDSLKSAGKINLDGIYM
jgi:hypothetical protein